MSSTGYRFKIHGHDFLDTGEALLAVKDLPLIDPVAGSADWFAGMAFYQSELLPVTDLGRWFGLPHRVTANVAASANNNNGSGKIPASVPRQQLLILQLGKGGEKMALLVDSVGGFTTETSAQLPENFESVSSGLEQLGDLGVETRSRLLAVMESVRRVGGNPMFVCNLGRLLDLPSFLDVGQQRRSNANSKNEHKSVAGCVAEQGAPA